MFPAAIPPELAAHLREIGINLPPPAKPRDPVSDASARDGVIRQWMPAYPNEEPPF
jgi:hypothetical protein